MFSGSELERAFFLFCWSAGLSRQRAPINESVVAHDGERSGILGRVKVVSFHEQGEVLGRRVQEVPRWGSGGSVESKPMFLDDEFRGLYYPLKKNVT